jgi:hypothetical protein
LPKGPRLSRKIWLLFPTQNILISTNITTKNFMQNTNLGLLGKSPLSSSFSGKERKPRRSPKKKPEVDQAKKVLLQDGSNSREPKLKKALTRLI